MAQMVPDRLPSRASKGEERLFGILKQLPETYIVYYEPMIQNRYPDFIVICPDMGLLVIEVKGWYPRDIVSADSNTVIVKEAGREVRHDHPIRQARDYMLNLMDRCKELPNGGQLLEKEGDFKNRFTFPFGHFAILSNITSEQLANHKIGDLTQVFPSDKVVTRDVLVDDWSSQELSDESLKQTLKNFFNPFWEIKPMDENQISILRGAIHPEVVINQNDANSEQETESPKNNVDIKTLDLRQENNARRIGDGHRIIYGVAGSGKTVLLIAKARLLAQEKPDEKILMLCFNVSLASFLRQTLQECENLTVLHFDGWAKANGVIRRDQESDWDLGERLKQRLESDNAPHSRHFDAVMIDEAQDFEVNWFSCVLEAMKDPNDDDLVIVGDGSQSLYGNRKIRWADIGIQAQGRTIYTQFDLDKNYRNSREILDLASIFSSEMDSSEPEYAILAPQVYPNKCLRSTGIKPRLVKSEQREDETKRVLAIVKGLLDGNWFGESIEPLQPHEIGIFYPYARRSDRSLIEELIEGLETLTSVIWVNRNRSQRNRIGDSAIKIQTIHSSKGLQYRAVVLMWADLLPKPFENSNEDDDRKLFYVGLTRPEDYLVISASDTSKFVSEVAESDKVKIA